MTKLELIDAIRKQNASAAVQFLMAFDEPALATYLRRLSLVDNRGTASGWVREGSDSAVTVRDCLVRRQVAAA